MSLHDTLSSAPPVSFGLIVNPPDGTIIAAIKYLHSSDDHLPTMKDLKSGLEYTHPIWSTIPTKKLKCLLNKYEQPGYILPWDLEDAAKMEWDDEGDVKQQEINAGPIPESHMYLISNVVAQLSAEVNGDVEKLPEWLKTGHVDEGGAGVRGMDMFMVQGMMFMTCQTGSM